MGHMSPSNREFTPPEQCARCDCTHKLVVHIKGKAYDYDCGLEQIKEDGGYFPFPSEVEPNKFTVAQVKRERELNPAPAPRPPRAPQRAVPQKPQPAPPPPPDAEAVAAREQQLRDLQERMEHDRRENPRQYPGGASGRPRVRVGQVATCAYCGRQYEAFSSPVNRKQYCGKSHATAAARARQGLAAESITLTGRRRLAKVPTLEEFEAREPQPSPESYTPTPWGSANAAVDPEEEQYYRDNPSARR